MLVRPLLAVPLLAAIALPATAQDVRVPAEFMHDQVWVTPRIGGETLRFFTDTGGGWNAIADTRVDRLGLPRTAAGEGEVVDWPAFDADASIPAAPGYFMDGRLAVAPAGQLFGGDGFLGGRWFADGIWAFDYPRGTLHRLGSVDGAAAGATRVPLGFQTDAEGRRTTHFPSIDVTVDGEVLVMLYDSGATAITTTASAPVFGVAPDTLVGTSFIETEVFERWMKAHPQWRVLDAADRKGPRLARMIEVPEVTIAGHAVGPVWFSEQPKGAFQSYMAGMMDRPAWGALGGSALKYFRVVLDYPGAAAYFERRAD